MRDKFGVASRHAAKMNQRGRNVSDFQTLSVRSTGRESVEIRPSASIVKTLKSWLSWNGDKINRRIEIPKLQVTEV